MGGGTSGDHTNECGVSFEHRRGLGRHGSFRRACHRRGKPWRESPDIRCRLPKAGRSGIHALHGTRPCCHPRWPAGLVSIPPRVARWRPARNPRTRPRLTRRWPITHWPASLGPLGAGFQPAVLVRESNPRQPDSRSGALSAELTWLTRPSVRTHLRNTSGRPPHWRTGQRAPLARPYHCLRRDAGGNRTHLNRVAAGRLAIWLQRQASSPGVEPGLRPSQGRVQGSATLRGRSLLSAPPRN